MSGTGIDLAERVSARRSPLTGAVIPLAIFAGALLVAYAGALLTGTPTEGVNARVEALSSSSTGFLGDLGRALPFGFAFAAGMVTAVNPCGFSLLPAYLGIFLADGRGTEARVARLQHALVVSLTMAVGFTLLFAGVGFAIGSGAQVLVGSFSWIGLGVGIVLAAVAALLLGGRKIYSTLGQDLATRIGGTGESNLRGYFLFGLSYGTASLSCTLPVFLLVVGGSLTSSRLLPSLGQFLLYGLGMASVVTALTLSIALFESALVGHLRRAMRFVEPVSGIMLLLSATYIIYYWLTLGGLLEKLS